MELHKKFFFLIIFLLVQISLFGQQKYYYSVVTDTIPINFENSYSLSHVSIVPFSESILLRGKSLKSSDYKISYQTSTFQLSDSLPYSVFDTLFVTYQTYNLLLKKEYKKRSLVIKYNSEFGDTVKVAKNETGGFTSEDIFGSNIEKSGTIVRGFTVGTTKDFSLNSGLRLQLSGKLADNIEVVAALTDENTPIQPEGNTERLQELDKVFIQIKHPNAVGTFGDYQLTKNYGEFGVINRKLQGLLGEFNYSGQNAYIAFASAKGKFNTNNFNGTDGVQGPYRLTGANGEPSIIIIAGSENVYVDGVQMKRGDANDYTIEYSNATITFTPNRLITSASRISVDFEYTDQRYQRNLFASGVQGNFFENKMDVKFQYIREGDNQDAPIDITLSDSDKTILKNAGDNRLKASKSGVSLAQPDSLGRVIGIYQKIDTVISGTQYPYYKYNPGDSLSLYNVTFSFVGDQKGDYAKQSLGNYTFVGINQGSYSPIIFLPLPELKQMGNVVLDFNLFEGIKLSLEYAGSLYDKNRFSNLDQSDNYGYARNIFLQMNPKKINIGKISLGKVGFSYKDRFIQDRFTALDRFNSVEFNRDYNISQDVSSESETLRELNLNLIPIDDLNINSSVGLLKKGDNFSSNRYNNIIKLTNNSDYEINYNLDYVDTKNLDLKSYWLRQTGNAFYKIWKLKPGVEFLAENKKDFTVSSDSLLSTSLKYNEIDPFIQLNNLSGIDLSAKYSVRKDYLPLNGIMQYESKSLTQFYTLSYHGIKEVNSTFNFTYRSKKYKGEFRNQGNLDNETILIRSQSGFRFWDPLLNGNLFYQVSTQKTAKLQKVFVRVQSGTGNYKYLGDLNNNGIADENEFEPTNFEGDYIQVTVPTETLYPVINLQTSTRWKIKFSELFDKSSTLGFLFNPLSTETYWQIEENSREPDYKRIYLLNFAYFQNPETTIHGSNYIQQDIFLFENDPEFSLRFRFAQTKSLDQFNDGTFKSYSRERSLRIKFKLIEELGNQTDLFTKNDNAGGPASSNRNRLITSNGMTTDFSYRPQRNIEVGFKIEVSRKEDDFPASPTIIDKNAQTLRFNLSLSSKGRLNIEIERDELISNTNQNFLPFELTEGNVIGKNYYWRLNFDYRLSNNLQSSVNYDGRVLGGGKVIHTARAEVRAYF